ncbi:NMD3-domain-containing protein [Sistotremastrum suecicum HHB10207 ss-3]|uniref:60S ribosomal export protein NMD3 n=1 Tax=Sistotremastrum suecicum HHB10207 ss-3 TaxID=1314776 RepID=A0A166C347_9AGAM|nr:NMD3-domain-containing protein [Sistotremastrum suecicum HHB10207 ss-3]
MEFTPAPAVHRVLCADCGDPIEPNSANLCIRCLRNSVDITEGIPKQASLAFCRNCDRFLSPPQTWTIAQPESRELLAICLKKLKGLNKVRLIDAGFIWTEPHSKRIKVKLTIQKEVFTSTVMQQVFQVEYLVQHGQCPDCAKLAAKNTWKALVQVRQKVPHKRTFLFLEQLILKHNAQKDTISVKEVKDGLDFFYAQRSHAIKMVEFLAGVVPVRTKSSEQLLSTDTHSNTANYKFTYSVEILPICKDDVACMPMKQAKSLSNISPLTIATRVGNSLHLLDPSTLQTADISAPVYWRNPFYSLASVSDLVEFTVLDIEPSGPVKGKWVLADAQVAMSGAFRSQKDDMDADMDDGSTSQIFHTRTHLGAILQPGDTALGYHLTNANFNNDHFSSLPTSRIPDIILVKKAYPNSRKKNKNRNWRLKSIAKEVEEGNDGSGAGRGVVGHGGGRNQKKVDEDYEIFLRELEEDQEMRGAINLYKAGGAKPRRPKGQGAMEVEEETPAQPAAVDHKMDEDDETGDEEDIGPSLDELLDDLHIDDEEGDHSE